MCFQEPSLIIVFLVFIASIAHGYFLDLSLQTLFLNPGIQNNAISIFVTLKASERDTVRYCI